MTAININIEEFLRILVVLRQKGVKLINLDMLPDESNPKMNKLIIHPVNLSSSKASQETKSTPEDIITRDPEVNTDNNDIFNLFNGIV